jgi:hypothetical protein
VLDRIAAGNGLWDLAPVVMWLAIVAAVSQPLPHRVRKYGQPPIKEPPKTSGPVDAPGRTTAASGPEDPRPDVDGPVAKGEVTGQLTGTSLRR